MLLVAALPLALACSDWPRHANLPRDTGSAALPGSTAFDGQIDWSDGGESALPTTAPGEAEPLAVGQGLYWQSTLLGTGMDPEAEVVRNPDPDCEDPWQFPPEQRAGGYLGEVAWFGLSPSEDGVLCAEVRFGDPSVQAELLLYYLSDCGAPRGPEIDEGTGAVLGFDSASPSVAWADPVIAETPVAVALVAVAPDDAAKVADYRLGLSLLPPVDAEQAASCPTLPE